MDILSDIKKHILKAAGADLEFTYPPTPDLGDLSLPVFALAKKEGKNPAAVAEKLAAKIKRSHSLKKMVSEIKIAGAYLNIYLNREYLFSEIFRAIEKDKAAYGRQKNPRPEKIMIEYSNGNTHKEYHVGHLRNICYGDAVARLLAAVGQKTISVSYINDFGIHTAKTLWGYLKFHQDKKFENPGRALGEIYAEAVAKLGDNKEALAEAGQIMKAIESRKGDVYRLWEKTRNWSIKYFSEIYEELGVKFAGTFYESEVIAAGLKIVEDLQKKNILEKSDGAIIANLEKYNLGVLPIIRSDGTALYPAADLALAVKKFEKYHLDQSIYIVDVRQSLYFKQLFKILELMGYRAKMTHLIYEFVTLPTGMMSSRTGNVITYQNLLADAKIRAQQETARRHVDWKDSRIEKLAADLAIATVKFEMLKVSANKIITFNLDEALRYDGYTATYLEYTHARIRTLLKKAGGFSKSGADYKNLAEAREAGLIVKLAKFPEIIARAAASYDPSEAAKYLFELARIFNDYYHETPVIKAEKNIRNARLRLLTAVGQVLVNGLEILGIKALPQI